jgi:uncharacterized protein YjbI with pentapeptide repeats
MQAMRKSFVKMIAITAAIFLVAIGQAGAWDRLDLEQLLRARQCPDCNLSEAILSLVDLRDVNLAGANLYKANLSQARLQRADLKNANLYRTNLASANLTGADLRNAILVRANVDGVNLRDANLSGATWIDGRKCAKGSIGECK